MSLLVSLCNRNQQQYPSRNAFLLDVDTTSGKVRPIEFPAAFRQGSTGMMGLTAYPGGYIGMLHPRTLIYLSRSLEVEYVRELTEVQDGHSVCYYRGATYIVSTGTDRILRVPDNGGIEIFWQASQSGIDTVHVNSIVWNNDECFISAFGKKKGALWRSADDGYVFNITRGEYVFGNIFHPHSVTIIDGKIWVCESSRLSLINNAGLKINTSLGYLRGLCKKENFFYIGSTVGRNKSKSTGITIDNQADPGVRSGACGIAVIDAESSQAEIIGFIDLSSYADEIYDIVSASSVLVNGWSWLPLEMEAAPGGAALYNRLFC